MRLMHWMHRLGFQLECIYLLMHHPGLDINSLVDDFWSHPGVLTPTSIYTLIRDHNFVWCTGCTDNAFDWSASTLWYIILAWTSIPWMASTVDGIYSGWTFTADAICSRCHLWQIPSAADAIYGRFHPLFDASFWPGHQFPGWHLP